MAKTIENKSLKLKLNKVLLDTQINDKQKQLELIRILKSEWRRNSSDVTTTFAKVMLNCYFSENYADTIITQVATEMNTDEFYEKNSVDLHRVIIEMEYNNYD